ncbi:AAA ATPase central domain protein [Pseudoxanthomonas suwonensis 11-1]|uniref:Uncharacterized AAA domain-containing protein ycf46 n=1 Tax=Pseudoxanthomonas suwonensis (strain 11-1) TaxID=743721 RepID=E6WP41_PSEUU|nr:AAA family ATPase [Pseudoxanthomonas suwonensis]ADV25940.1 AAA ATPase central domain protein [Pseudoxanthomonas suwonensis 11-1]
MSQLQDLTALIRANTPLVVIETRDEDRVVELFRQSLMHVWRALHRWTITEGLRRLDLDREDPADGPPDASYVLRAIQEADQRGIYLLLDFHPYLGYASHQRLLRDILQRRHCEAHVVVLVGARVELPPELEAMAVRFTPRLPDAAALLKLVREEAEAYAREHGRRAEADPEAVKRIVRNLQGLDLHDARRIARQLIHDDGALTESDLPQLAKLKFELLNRSGHLHYEYDAAALDGVAGARRLKRWVQLRKAAFAGSPPPGLDPPRGILLLGVQGCGKSLLAKAIAAGFGVPLLRLDFGTLYAKYHGETEQNLRSALASADQLAPCVLWVDEIEKGVAADGGDSDGGVSRRVLGYLLTWMSERKAPVFLVATANQVQHLPAELLRKGRFDEIFFVDLPNPDTRVELLRIHLSTRGLQPDEFNLPALAAAANGFSGAEIEQAIVSGLYAAHASQGPLDTTLLMEEIRNTRPLSVLMAEQVAALREWALPRTVPAD